jgi:hypothetical protein
MSSRYIGLQHRGHHPPQRLVVLDAGVLAVRVPARVFVGGVGDDRAFEVLERALQFCH